MKRLVRIAGIGFALCILAGSVFALRLARGPIQLDFLSPRIERALTRADGSLVFRVGGMEIAWDAHDRDLELRVHEVEITGPTGQKVATVPAFALGLSARALLRREIVPTRVELREPRLRLVRRPDGRIDLGVGDANATVEPPQAGGIVSELFGPEEDGALRLISVRDGELVLAESDTERTWRAEHVALALSPEERDIAGRLHADLVLGTDTVRVQANARYRRTPERADVELSFRGLLPSTLGLDVAGLPLDGSVHLDLDGALRLVDARAHVTAGAGTLALPGLAPGARVDRADLVATFEPPSKTLEVQALTLGLGEATARLRGRATARDAGAAIEMDGTLENLPTAALPGYWPEGVADGARRWVTANVSGGRVREATVRLTGETVGTDPRAVSLGTVIGTFTFDGVDVRGLPSMPPVSAVAGKGALSGNSLTVRIARGRLDRLEIVDATVRLPTAPRAGIAVEAATRGPLASALAVLDQALGGGLRAQGVSPPDVAGTVNARLSATLPLDGSVELPKLGVKGSAHLRGVTIPRLVREDWSLTAGDFRLTLAGDRADLTGAARIQDAPVTVAWHEELVPPRREIDVRGRIDPAVLGFDLRPWLVGPVDASARLAHGAGPVAHVDLDADLTSATLAMTGLDLHKPAGAPGRARARLTLAGRAVVAIEDVRLEASGSSVTGRATLSPDGATWRTVDAAALVAPGGPGEKPGHFQLTLRPGDAGSRLTIRSDDAGALFRALGPYSDAEGGRILVEGAIDLSAPDLPFDGRVDVGEFRVTHSPLLARVASLTSLSEIAAGLAGRGVSFSRLTAGLSHRRGVVTISDLLLRGPSLGLSVHGTVDRNAGTLALEGTLVPSYYGLNRLPGRIPIIGPLVTGQGTGAVQAFDFTATGSLDDPRVSVQPFSSLAPGALRDLMRALRGGGGDAR